MSLQAYDPVAGLHDLRRARLRRRLADVHWVDALYNVYLTALLSTIVVLFLSSWVGDRDVSAAGLIDVQADGPPLLGFISASAVAVGLRSGSRGGPLALERADVRHVLLSPVDRGAALRGPAYRQLRFGLFVGAIVGAIAGQLAVRRLGGAPAAWVASGAAFGATTVALALGLGLLVAGLRLRRWVASLIALVLVGWSAADVAQRPEWVPSAPLDPLGRLALSPLHVDWLGAIPAVAAVLAIVAGLLLLGGMSLEAAERRSGLVGQMRFAATLQDVRTVIVLRRQLALEFPRLRPWFARRRRWQSSGAGAPSRPTSLWARRFPVWTRDWRGIRRWPLPRVVRLVILASVAALSLRGVWEGTTPLVVVAGLSMFLIGLEGVEPLAQEVDHPTRRDSYPVDSGALHLQHLPAAVVVVTVVGVVGGVVGVLTGPSVLSLELAAWILGPAVLGAVAGAAISIVSGAPGTGSEPSLLAMAGPPEAAGMGLVLRTAWPPALAVLGVLPVLSLHAAYQRGMSLTGAGMSSLLGAAIVFTLIGGWIRFREGIRLWFAQQMEEGARMREQRTTTHA